MATKYFNTSFSPPKLAARFEDNGEFEILDSYIFNEIRNFGISIPKELEKDFGRYKLVPLPLKTASKDMKLTFKKAFEEIYFPTVLAPLCYAKREVI